MATTNPDSSAPSVTSGEVRLRISDVLALPLDDDEPEEKYFQTHPRWDLRSLLMDEEDRRRGQYCSSPPCRVVGRWVSWIRRVKIKKCCRRESGEERAEVGVQARCSTNGLNEVGCRNEAGFNAGIGAYLLYLVAATRNELDRINAARVEMETILGDAKQLQRRRLSVEGNGGDVLLELTIRKSVVVEEEEDQPQFATNQYALPAAAASASSFSSTVVSGSETPKRGEFLEDMGQLEAELEAELELLQLQLDGDKSMEQSQLQRAIHGEEAESSKTYSMTSSSSSSSSSSSEVIHPDHAEVYADYYPSGVSPHELETRLHELLEARQQQEIRELEAALELVKIKLEEKELQVSWWKAVARGRTKRRLSISSSHFTESP